MRLTPACLSLLLFAFHEADAGTAFEALKFLTPEQLQRVALIAAREGTPEPERWHVLVHDPASADTGLREVVVSRGKKIAERSISQFAEKLSASDIIPPEMLKVDSDKVSKLAMRFGTANNVIVSAMHFDLRRAGPESAPLWTVTCLDASGTELGKLIVSAMKGTVLLHPGFVAEPPDAIAENATVVARASETSVDAAPSIRKTAPPPPLRRRATPPPATATPKTGFLQRLFTPPDKDKTPPR